MFSTGTKLLHRYRYTLLVFMVLVYRSSSLVWIKQALGVNPKRTGRVVETRLNNPIQHAALMDGCEDPYEDSDSDYDDDGCTSCTADYDEPANNEDYDDGCSGCDSHYEADVYYEEDYNDDGCSGCDESGPTGPPPTTQIQKTVRFVFTVEQSSTVLLRVAGVSNQFEKILVAGAREPDVYEVVWYGYLDVSNGITISDGSYRAELTVNSLTVSKTFYYSNHAGFDTPVIIF